MVLAELKGTRHACAPSVAAEMRCFPLTDLLFLLLRVYAACAEAYLGQPISKAVITCPAYFSQSQAHTVPAGCLCKCPPGRALLI